MTSRLRIVVGGYLGLLPAGGVTWDYLQYPLGLAEMGCDVYYLEDTRLWPVYKDSGDASDASENVAHLAEVMQAFGLENRWAYRDEASAKCFGLSEPQLQAICRTADVFLNISCSTVMRDEYHRIPVRALVDSDPMFTQMQLQKGEGFTVGDSNLRELVDAHTHHFTFGESFGTSPCRIPDCGVHWHPTRQPITLRHWPVSAPPPPHAAYTTVMNWSSAPPVRWQGVDWGQKDVELLKILDLPASVPEISLAVAVGQTTGARFPTEQAARHGWTLLDPTCCAGDWRRYRNFIRGSRGELSVAKETYVKARTGWFSCRSACYLASGRPVVTQETGWSRHIPAGEGLFAFNDKAEAAEALRCIERDWDEHSRAARRIAEEHFASETVLRELLGNLGVWPE